MPARKPSSSTQRRNQILREWARIPADAERFESHSVPPITAAIPRALKKIGLDDRWRHQQIAAAWPDLVGSAIARHAQPVAFQHGRLIIGVAHSTWLRELSHLKPQLLEKLRAHLGDNAPKDILLRIS